MHVRVHLSTFVIFFAGLVGSASAVTAWDEAINGDLSSNAAAPTLVSLSPGSNVILGTISSAAPADARDYLTFSIAPGQALTQLRQLGFVDIPGGGAGNRAFHALIAGSTSLVPNAMNIGSFLGSNHVDQLAVGTDMLPDLAMAITGGTGFVTPLGPGTYTYLIQQTGTQKDGYSLDFVVAPEPASALLLLCTALPLAALRRRG